MNSNSVTFHALKITKQIIHKKLKTRFSLERLKSFYYIRNDYSKTICKNHITQPGILINLKK